MMNAHIYNRYYTSLLQVHFAIQIILNMVPYPLHKITFDLLGCQGMIIRLEVLQL